MIESLEKLGERALTFPEKASAIIVHDAETLKEANDFLLAIKAIIKEIKDSFSASKKKTHEAHKAVVAQEQGILKAPLKAEEITKLQIGVYVRKVEEKRREAERKIYEAEQERLRKEAEIEAEAQRFENHGHRKEADEIRETKPAPVVETLPDAPSLNGVSISKLLKWEETDLSKIDRKFLMIDKSKVNEFIKENREKILNSLNSPDRFPPVDVLGIRFYLEDSVSARS